MAGFTDRQSNLPPGITDRQIEEAQDAEYTEILGGSKRDEPKAFEGNVFPELTYMATLRVPSRLVVLIEAIVDTADDDLDDFADVFSEDERTRARKVWAEFVTRIASLGER
jgi:hypothetical protein